MKELIIELRGVEFHNKGAELMLYAILEQVRERKPDTIFVMEKRYSVPIKKQRQVGIYTKANIVKFGVNTAFIAKMTPKFIRRKLKFILEEEINVVLDGSGFAFGDFWGAKKAGSRLADHIINWKQSGKKIIVLPQAFGPFTNTELQDKMKIILNNADLIFARDSYSYDYLTQLKAKNTNVFLKPDFTNLIKGKLPSYFESENVNVAIIPNNKLLESTVFSSRDEYVAFLNRLTDLITGFGKTPFFLIHEGAKDMQLAVEVNSQYKKSIKIIKEDNPLYVKGIIGKSDAVITSRFHGLVSALAQGVPCLCVGWSHKYLALVEDYGYAQGLIKNDELMSEALSSKVTMILDAKQSAEIKDLLLKASVKQKADSADMWDAVFKTIGNYM